jgi:hypothetical protein
MNCPPVPTAGMPTKLCGFDSREPTGHQGGKPRAIARLREIFPYETVSRAGLPSCPPNQLSRIGATPNQPARWVLGECSARICCVSEVADLLYCFAVLVLPQIVMIGDGITDLEAVQESGGADMFVGFGGACVSGCLQGRARKQRPDCCASP